MKLKMLSILLYGPKRGRVKPRELFPIIFVILGRSKTQPILCKISTRLPLDFNRTRSVGPLNGPTDDTAAGVADMGARAGQKKTLHSYSNRQQLQEEHSRPQQTATHR